jgi:hypothetical protein
MWETAYATSYQIQVSSDNSTWTTIYSTTTGAGGVELLTGLSEPADTCACTEPPAEQPTATHSGTSTFTADGERMNEAPAGGHALAVRRQRGSHAGPVTKLVGWLATVSAASAFISAGGRPRTRQAVASHGGSGRSIGTQNAAAGSRGDRPQRRRAGTASGVPHTPHPQLPSKS